MNWAPYRYGHWAWISPWGWTWIDDAPWGFAPFHYGRWAYLGSRWAWVPGRIAPRPVYAPAMAAFVDRNIVVQNESAPPAHMHQRRPGALTAVSADDFRQREAQRKQWALQRQALQQQRIQIEQAERQRQQQDPRARVEQVLRQQRAVPIGQPAPASDAEPRRHHHAQPSLAHDHDHDRGKERSKHGSAAQSARGG